MTQAQTARLTLTDVAHGGEAVGRLDRQVVFVPFGIPGEEVVVEIVEQRKRYARGRIVEVLSPSLQRVAPPCPYFGTCGGCQFQHVAYEAQLGFKRQVVESQLRRIGGFADPPVGPALPSPASYHYRNHARFTVDQGRLGFNRASSHLLLPIEYCFLVPPLINDVLSSLQKRCPAVPHIVVRVGVRTGDLAISPRLPRGLIPYPSGQRWLTEVVGGHRFRISTSSFFQVNTEQGDRLVKLVQSRLADRRPRLLVDAYCGVGTFAVLLADLAQRVLGIEEVPGAVEDARANAIGLLNVAFIEGQTERVLPDLDERVDALVMDPAREGCQPRVIEALVERQPPLIIYVSCDPATLARDLRLLCDGPYRLVEVQPVDMFPQTYHIENVATLVLE